MNLWIIKLLFLHLLWSLSLNSCSIFILKNVSICFFPCFAYVLLFRLFCLIVIVNRRVEQEIHGRSYAYTLTNLRMRTRARYYQNIYHFCFHCAHTHTIPETLTMHNFNFNLADVQYFYLSNKHCINGHPPTHTTIKFQSLV